MKEVEKRTCYGCGREFSVLNIGEGVEKYCTPECKEEHTIFDKNN